MENNIPTALDFVHDNLWWHKEGKDRETYTEKGDILDTDERVAEKMIEFAKLHVKAALEAASEKAQTKYSEYPSYGIHDLEIDKRSILSAYPEENIK